MKIINGKPVSPGYAQGHTVVLDRFEVASSRSTISKDRIEIELERFHIGLDESYRELAQLQARVAAELGAESADIFSAHLLFLKDPQFIDRVSECIRNDLLALEAAIQVTIDELVSILSEADNSYMRERTADIKDLHRRLLRHVRHPGADQLAQLSPESVIVARELLPSDLLDLDRDHVIGIITETGGETDHTAILARALGIPAVTGITDATHIIRNGMCILLDGQSGEVVIEPAQHQLQASITNMARYDDFTKLAIEAEQCECITRDGVTVHLLANIGRPFEAQSVTRHHLEGVGLFRTEYLFLDEPVAPSFERQQEIYRKIAAAVDGLPLVIRTLDLGGDKWPAFLQPRFEANPNLGVRGLRFSLLAAEKLFRIQVRAALFTANENDVRIMLPMVLGRADLSHAIDIIRSVADEAGIHELPPIGSLIETPAAIFSIDEILAASDFISIGTNDLTQYILAADRNALATIDDYTVLHPSVLRAIHRVIDAADAVGKPATICGEAAADPGIACLLVGLGARRLSMSPTSAARVRNAVRHSDSKLLDELAEKALNSDSANHVSKLITKTLNNSI